MKELFAIDMHLVSKTGSDYTYTAYRIGSDAEELELEAGKIAATMSSPDEYCDSWHVRQTTDEEKSRYAKARRVIERV